MDEISFVKELVSYGALGIVTLYFIYKDVVIVKQDRESRKEHAEAMRDFTMVLHEIKGRLFT